MMERFIMVLLFPLKRKPFIILYILEQILKVAVSSAISVLTTLHSLRSFVDLSDLFDMRTETKKIRTWTIAGLTMT